MWIRPRSYAAPIKELQQTLVGQGSPPVAAPRCFIKASIVLKSGKQFLTAFFCSNTKLPGNCQAIGRSAWSTSGTTRRVPVIYSTKGGTRPQTVSGSLRSMEYQNKTWQEILRERRGRCTRNNVVLLLFGKWAQRTRKREWSAEDTSGCALSIKKRVLSKYVNVEVMTALGIAINHVYQAVRPARKLLLTACKFLLRVCEKKRVDRTSRQGLLFYDPQQILPLRMACRASILFSIWISRFISEVDVLKAQLATVEVDVRALTILEWLRRYWEIPSCASLNGSLANGLRMQQHREYRGGIGLRQSKGTPARNIAGSLTIYNVRGNGQDREVAGTESR